MADTESETEVPQGAILDEEGNVEWSPPISDADGVFQEGDYPHNHRLRAEALAREGKTSDPGDLITDELIASTAERLAGEAEATAKAEAEAAAEQHAATEVEAAARTGNGRRAAASPPSPPPEGDSTTGQEG